ncbi:MAG: ATP-binding protein [Anaerolineae bacterium]|nr:ATP-binding protein [Anaerolineae bacterium]
MVTREFFFHHRLGYSKNPFGALTAEEWTAVAFIPPAVQQILDEGFTHLQLLGPKGCGKTTTLLKLAAMAQAQGQSVVYEYLPEGQSHFGSWPTSGGVFVLDEAQRLRRGERKRWLGWGTAVTFIFSSHTDLTPYFHRAHLPLTTIWLDAEISLAHYHTWLERRLAYFALPGKRRLELADTAVAALYHHFGRDLREAEYFLYELFQHPWPEPADGERWLLTGEDLTQLK